MGSACVDGVEGSKEPGSDCACACACASASASARAKNTNNLRLLGHKPGRNRGERPMLQQRMAAHSGCGKWRPATIRRDTILVW